MSEPIRIKRTVNRATPNKVTALWLLGIFIVGSALFIGIQIGNYFSGIFDPSMAYLVGVAFALLTCSVVAWFTMIIQENAQDIQIRVVQQK